MTVGFAMAQNHWVGTWGTAPQLVENNNNPPSPGLGNNSLRQIVQVSIGGKKVRLLELQGCLGGIWTAGLLTYIFDFNKSDIGWEIIRRLDAYGARAVDRPGEDGMRYYKDGVDKDWVYAPEYMKAVCEDMCAEAGVRVTLQCPVVAARG